MDLEYFRNELICLYEVKELTEDELIDLKGFVNTIITHITNGNKNEDRGNIPAKDCPSSRLCSTWEK